MKLPDPLPVTRCGDEVLSTSAISGPGKVMTADSETNASSDTIARGVKESIAREFVVSSLSLRQDRQLPPHLLQQLLQQGLCPQAQL